MTVYKYHFHLTTTVVNLSNSHLLSADDVVKFIVNLSTFLLLSHTHHLCAPSPPSDIISCHHGSCLAHHTDQRGLINSVWDQIHERQVEWNVCGFSWSEYVGVGLRGKGRLATKSCKLEVGNQTQVPGLSSSVLITSQSPLQSSILYMSQESLHHTLQPL